MSRVGDALQNTGSNDKVHKIGNYNIQIMFQGAKLEYKSLNQIKSHKSFLVLVTFCFTINSHRSI